MSRIARTASWAVTSLCTLAIVAALPAEHANGALIDQAVVEPLPPTPALIVDPTDGIVRNLPAEASAEYPTSTKPVPTSASSLVDLVARHESATAGDRDINCLANAVYFEAKSEPLSGQLAVAQVIVNRAKSGRFASTLCGVVKQPSQFSFVRNGGFPPVVNAGMWRKAVAIANIAVSGLWSGPAEGAMFFHATRVSPNWGKQRIATIGRHVFYR